MQFSRALTVVAVLVALALSRLAAAASVADFLPYNFANSGGAVVMPGRIYVPTEYAGDPTVLRPLILFLHGSGESGTDNLAQINGNIDNLLTAAKARGAFLYAPQTNVGWANETRLTQAMAKIDQAIAEYHVDPNRIYVTGLSMGGGGAWTFLNMFPDRVAATVPICGTYPWPDLELANVVSEPIWAFHGRFDYSVPVAVTRSVIDSLLTYAGQPLPTYPPNNSFGPNVQFDFSAPPLDLHYTDYRGNHGIWPQVYDTPEMYDWLFAHGSVPEPSSLLIVLCGLTVIATRRASR